MGEIKNIMLLGTSVSLCKTKHKTTRLCKMCGLSIIDCHEVFDDFFLVRSNQIQLHKSWENLGMDISFPVLRGIK